MNHPMGNNFGAAGDIATQTRILRSALALVESATTGGVLEDLPTRWPEPFEFRPGSANTMG